MIKYEDNLAARLNGNNLQPLAGASVSVSFTDTGAPATIYADDGVTVRPQPLTTDNNGYFGFKAPDGKYTLTISGVRFATFTREIVLDDPDDNMDFKQVGAGAVTRKVQDKLGEIVSVKDFGAKGDGVTDDADALNAAFLAGVQYVPPGTYRCTKPLKTYGTIYSDGPGAGFKFNLGATPVEHLIYALGEGDILNIEVDGTTSTNVGAGVWLNADTWVPTRRIKTDVRIKNIRNDDNTKPCYGLAYYVSSGCQYDGYQADLCAVVDNVQGTANGVNGDNGGAATGVAVSINKAGLTTNINILTSKVSRVSPAEDGDGILIYVADHTSVTQRSSFLIDGAIVSACAKRGIKSLAPNCVIRHASVDMDVAVGTSSQLGIDCYGINNTVDSPRIKSTYGGDGVRAQGANFQCLNVDLSMTAAVAPVRIAGCDGFLVSGGHVYTGHSFASSDSGAVLVSGGRGHVDAPRCINANNTGAVVAVEGVSSGDVVTVRVPSQSKAETLLRVNSCAGRIVLEKGHALVSGHGIHSTDSADLRVEGADIATSAADKIAVYSVRSTVQLVGAGRFSGFKHGYLTSGVPAGSGVRRVVGGWYFEGGNGTGVGIDAAATNAEIVGVFTSGYATHIQADYSTKCLIANNTARGGGTHITNTGATGLVTYNNNLIP